MSRLIEAVAIIIKESAPDMIAADQSNDYHGAEGWWEYGFDGNREDLHRPKPGFQETQGANSDEKRKKRRIQEKTNPMTTPHVAIPLLWAI
jgi:hypothetical protein